MFLREPQLPKNNRKNNRIESQAAIGIQHVLARSKAYHTVRVESYSAENFVRNGPKIVFFFCGFFLYLPSSTAPVCSWVSMNTA